MQGFFSIPFFFKNDVIKVQVEAGGCCDQPKYGYVHM